ncbi:hypothetical protein [Nocardia bovistercoris]|uniref:Uncharacterized protein n=1 Tax=Nocardia bovistercoris TaxID=2785916 RepID=A0A931N092_9NOCA|nr:hypothetical protein [Nocardia bovistercoris]MBH0774799.1 hypothetical protein [Nocardia bovistercoris]
MSEASIEVLLDDFETKENWNITGPDADRTHITTFAEGAPSKTPGVYADGAAGADHRAVALLVREAAADLEIELAPSAGKSFDIPGRLEALRLWIRSPHASVDVFARVGAGADARELPMGRLAASGEWRRAGHELAESLTDATVVGLRIRLTEVIKRAGEVMILLDDLTARTAR